MKETDVVNVVFYVYSIVGAFGLGCSFMLYVAEASLNKRSIFPFLMFLLSVVIFIFGYTEAYAK